jgi:hypothetical protein
MQQNVRSAGVKYITFGQLSENVDDMFSWAPPGALFLIAFPNSVLRGFLLLGG